MWCSRWFFWNCGTSSVFQPKGKKKKPAPVFQNSGRRHKNSDGQWFLVKIGRFKKNQPASEATVVDHIRVKIYSNYKFYLNKISNQN
jgi:hypothetical protein